MLSADVHKQAESGARFASAVAAEEQWQSQHPAS